MKKIIIVEDEFRIRNGLSTLINKLDMGCKVIGEAENGFEGLKMISDMEPEVVITDIKIENGWIIYDTSGKRNGSIL